MVSSPVFFFSYLLLPLVLSQKCEQFTPNSPSVISLQNCQTFFQLRMNVGTPPKPFIFLIDTGSLWTWLPTESCRCGKGVASSSPTSNITNAHHEIRYSDGDEVTGFEGTEAFSFDNTSFINANVPMVFVTEKRAPLMGDRGLVALGYSAENIFDSAYKQGKIETNAFILQLSDEPYKSKLYFDKLPSNIVDNSVYFPIITNLHLWTIRCIGLYIDGIDFSKNMLTTTLVDSGTTLTTLNDGLYKDIANRVFGSCQDTPEHGIICPLNTRLPTIQFYLQGTIVYLDPEHYTYKTSKGIQILLDSGNEIILGTSFFKSYGVIFDKKEERIGFHGKNQPLSIFGSNFFYRSSISMIAILGLVIILQFIVLICQSCYACSTPRGRFW